MIIKYKYIIMKLKELEEDLKNKKQKWTIFKVKRINND
jgi:hypothetical protein